MKTKMKKLASMLLVLAMLLSLSVTAFAADYATDPDSYINVTVNVVNEKDSSASYSRTVSVLNGSSVYAVIMEGKAKGYWTAEGEFYEDYDKNGNPLGTQSWYLHSLNSYSTEPCSEPPAGFPGDPEDWYQGYGLVDADPENDYYEYYYAGWAWEYSVSNPTGGQNVKELAMNKFVLHSGNDITLTYDLSTSQWDMDEPYTADSPYLPVNPPASGTGD